MMCCSWTTLSATDASAKVTNPKPRGFPVWRSRITTESVSLPKALKCVVRVSARKETETGQRLVHSTYGVQSCKSDLLNARIVTNFRR